MHISNQVIFGVGKIGRSFHGFATDCGSYCAISFSGRVVSKGHFGPGVDPVPLVSSNCLKKARLPLFSRSSLNVLRDSTGHHHLTLERLAHASSQCVLRNVDELTYTCVVLVGDHIVRQAGALKGNSIAVRAGRPGSGVLSSVN